MDDLSGLVSTALCKLWRTHEQLKLQGYVFTDLESEIRLFPPARQPVFLNVVVSRMTQLGWRVISEKTFEECWCSKQCGRHRFRHFLGTPEREWLVKQSAGLSLRINFMNGWSARFATSTETRVDSVAPLTCLSGEPKFPPRVRRRVSVSSADGLVLDVTETLHPDGTVSETSMELEIQRVVENADVAVQIIEDALTQIVL